MHTIYRNFDSFPGQCTELLANKPGKYTELLANNSGKIHGIAGKYSWKIHGIVHAQFTSQEWMHLGNAVTPFTVGWSCTKTLARSCTKRRSVATLCSHRDRFVPQFELLLFILCDQKVICLYQIQIQILITKQEEFYKLKCKLENVFVSNTRDRTLYSHRDRFVAQFELVLFLSCDWMK